MNSQILKKSTVEFKPVSNFRNFPKMVILIMVIFEKKFKNRIWVEFEKIKEFILVIVFVICPQKENLGFLGMQPNHNLKTLKFLRVLSALLPHGGDPSTILITWCRPCHVTSQRSTLGNFQLALLSHLFSHLGKSFPVFWIDRNEPKPYLALM